MQKFLFFFLVLFSQSLVAQQLISSNGNSFKNANLQIDYALGELAITTFQQGNVQISQGIMQPTYQVSVAANDAFDKAFTLKAFPNPTSGMLQIETDFEAFNEFTISDLQGKIILENAFYSPTIDLHFLPQGVYILVLKSKENFYKSLIINKL